MLDQEAGVSGQRCIPSACLEGALEHFCTAFPCDDRQPVPHQGELSLASVTGEEENWAQETSPKQLCFQVK